MLMLKRHTNQPSTMSHFDKARLFYLCTINYLFLYNILFTQYLLFYCVALFLQFVSSHVVVEYMFYTDVFCFSPADEIVALKRLKMEKEKEGFPITSLREINTLLKAQHPNIVTVRVR